MNQYAEMPVLEQLSGLRRHLDIMVQNNRDERAETREQIEMLTSHLGLARHTLDAVHGEWIAVVKLLSGALELLRESGDDEMADALRALLHESFDRMQSDLKPTLN
jgi:hypothetical protein